MLATLAGILIGYTQDALYLRTAVVVGVQGIFYALSIERGLLLLAEIHTAGQLTDADEVGTAYHLVLQGRLMYEAFESLYGTDIGIESQFLAHGQKSLLGTYLGTGVVVELRVTDAGKQHGIGFHAGLERVFGEGVTHLVDGVGATQGFLVGHFVAKLLSNGTAHGYTLLHNLRADTITGQHSNLEFHILLFF